MFGNVDWGWFLRDPIQWLFFSPVLVLIGAAIWFLISVRQCMRTGPKKTDRHDEGEHHTSIQKKLPKELRLYYEALEHGDAEGMKEHLLKNAETCPSRNGYCLNEIFCPECPLGNGGLAVQSGRHGI